jgi:diketogulonate reductase-like aldo/keto reductase
MGARTLVQAQDNLGALSIELDAEHIARLDQVSAPEPIFPQRFVSRPMVQQLMFGGARLQQQKAYLK